MPKYLVQASYTAQGLQGLIKDAASGRKAAIQKAVKSLGGKLETMYYAFGKDDVILIADVPGNTAAAALALAAGSSGLVRIRTTPLLTIEEADEAIALKSKYRAPGTE
jgi:uncharacterized protein with GYD domain